MNEKKNPMQDRSLLVGLLALVISLLSGILLFLHVPVLVCAILAIIGTLGGIAREAPLAQTCSNPLNARSV